MKKKEINKIVKKNDIAIITTTHGSYVGFVKGEQFGCFWISQDSSLCGSIAFDYEEMIKIEKLGKEPVKRCSVCKSPNFSNGCCYP